jgi:hypothetical protein
MRTEESLSDKQGRFCLAIAQFIIWLNAKGYKVVFGEVLRSDEQAEINALGHVLRGLAAKLLQQEPQFYALAVKIMNNGKANGIRGSLHELKLAVDLLLFKDGVYLTQTEDYREAGEYWELTFGGAWGGRFNDGNHFSFPHGGKK